MPTSNKSNLITIIFVIVLIVLGYIWYAYLSKGSDEVLTSTGQGGDTTTPKEFLLLLSTLESIKLDTSLFDDPLFNKLKGGLSLDDLPKVDSGRPNPFLPLSQTARGN